MITMKIAWNLKAPFIFSLGESRVKTFEKKPLLVVFEDLDAIIIVIIVCIVCRYAFIYYFPFRTLILQFFTNPCQKSF